ncbi:methyltransferase domain-containing protein [Nocardia sp. alder85J]|uniref:methyltransferase domain-containing protein n=1 Tax=Nocardia sp. alder85J TaxID=2862949 RepID=UPI001CD57F82|nr:methyltransferase domain-containing protein [Nocardia sp. alder85J]MCX4091572.1 methyltransferase domain-containing protein [Nocardia sp. alder85J]
MDSTGYVLNQNFPSERARLSALAQLWDAGTLRLVEDTGLGAGDRCLEAGAGTGSIAAALAAIVGTAGRVLAVDRDIRFLDDLPPQVEVRCADVMTDDLPPAQFDLVHARLLVAHLHPHREALRRLAAAVAPGGWLLVEEVDWTYADRIEPEEPLYTAMIAALTEIMGDGGFDARYGRRLLGDVLGLGLTEVSAQYRGLQSEHDNAWLAWQLLVEQFHDRIVARGLLSRDDVDRWWALSRAGTSILTGPAVFAVRARRPLPVD